MAKQDWKKLQAQFEHDHDKYGTGAKEWCDAKGLNYASARRYIKVRTIAQSGNAQTKTAQTAQKPKAQKKDAKKRSQETNCVPPSESDGREKRHLDDSEGKGERDSKGRFQSGHSVSVGNQGNTNVPSNSFVEGNQAARKGGLYARYFPEAKQHMFDAADTATLDDELMLTRARLQSGIEYLGKIHEDMASATTVEDRISLYESFTRVNGQLDNLTARIESITRTMSSLGLDLVNCAKVVEDTKRIRSATRKLTLEADKLSKEGKGDDTPISQMLEDLQSMGTGGLMSKPQ
ncbi:hypothetical protein [Enterovibrio sp. 27052020O]|uniref:hypothetical protein n=1 Tax=Enterovibrio sp. 27052020O TaxID=3241166 RepID=UPI003890307F